MPPPHDDDTDTVSLATLRELLGDQNTLALLERYGGVRLKLPRLRDTSWLARELGVPIADLLVKRFGVGSKLNIPIGRQFRVIALRQQGKSYSQIAAKLCMTESTVYRHVTEGKRLARQGALLKSIGDGTALLHKRTKVP